MERITLQDLKASLDTTPKKIHFGMAFLGDGDYEQFLELLDMAFDWIAQELAQNPELRCGRSEDQLTIEVVSMLKALTVEASHDTKVGGHCDIRVEARSEMLWLGEAKKLEKTDNGWIYKGFEQLNSRYSTALPGQDAGGMLIYCVLPRVDKVMGGWEDYLKKQVTDLTTSACERNPLAFRSQHPHPRTGRPYKVRHVPVSLYFQPKDREL